ncbi:hypothetical protein J3459_018345 [Metarhizium acridum]|nr:hypothetical protein J3459_018345 [Metarhizium acridum]
MGETDYMIVGVEEAEESKRHNGHSLLWMSGKFVLNEHNLPTFDIRGHGMLDHGVLYAAHIFKRCREPPDTAGMGGRDCKETAGSGTRLGRLPRPSARDC